MISEVFFNLTVPCLCDFPGLTEGERQAVWPVLLGQLTGTEITGA